MTVTNLIPYLSSDQNELINLENLKLWADWAVLHWTILLLTYFQNTNDPKKWLETLKLAKCQYNDDFKLLIQVLMRNSANFAIRFQFQEENFFSYPVEGEKRWWLEAKISILEENFIQEDCLWESSDHCISQICLTKGKLVF